MRIGKLEKVSLREIWKDEAREFLPWLEENIEYLNDALDISLSVIEREKSVGTFAADILAEDRDGNKVIIECQLEKTDHDHLGKVLTYLTNLEAKTAIWICSNPRPEHVKAVTWLNEVTPADVSFYLVKIEAVRIGESPPAPLFSVICAPSVEAKEIGEEKKKFAETHKKRLEFWKRLLEKAKKKTELHANVSPSTRDYISARKSGFAYSYVITMNEVRVELNIDRGDEKINKQIFDAFLSKRDEIESQFGESLDWDYVEGRHSCHIKWKCKEGGLKDEDKWEYLQDKMIDAMMRLEKAFKNHIRKLTI